MNTFQIRSNHTYECVQLLRENFDEVRNWCDRYWKSYKHPNTNEPIMINFLYKKEEFTAYEGDYVIFDPIRARFFTCKQYTFNHLYQRIDNDDWFTKTRIIS